MYPSTILPTEILELCLDELGAEIGDPDSRKALQFCCLTSHSLLARSQHHLFSKVQITWTDDVPVANVIRRLQKLQRILEDNAHLISRIRSLEVSVDRNGAVTHPETGLLNIINMLRVGESIQGVREPTQSRLRELRLAGRPKFPTLWCDMNVEFRLAFFRLMASPRSGPSTFHLSHFAAVPVTLITQCRRALQDITLDSVWFTKDDDIRRSTLSQEIRIFDGEGPALTSFIGNESVYRFAAALALTSPSSVALLSSLKTLQARVIQSKDVVHTREIIELTSESLESLEIGGNVSGNAPYFSDLCKGIDLTNLPRLRHFSIGIQAPSMKFSVKPRSCPIRLLDTFNFKSATSASLETIHITLYLELRRSLIQPGLAFFEHDECVSSSQLNSVLAEGKFTSLRKIQVDICMSVVYEDDCITRSNDFEEIQSVKGELEDHIRECLPALSGTSRSISFNLSIVASPNPSS